MDAVDGLFLRLERAVERFAPGDLNPVTQSGAVANLLIAVAIASGVALLVWYKPSVKLAHGSVTAADTSWLGSLVRSLHRYSSDACMLFVVLHAVRLYVARRVSGARWLAWGTGAVLLALLWFVGWLGYWLVWDQPAQLVALGSARMADVLPVFADPLSRTFLTDDSINSLLFFTVFFFHMLLPLGMGVALWLHVSRVSRARFLTSRAMTAWVLGASVAASLLFPIEAAPAARMAVVPQPFALDAWFLAPLALTDRLSGGPLWGLTVLGGLALLSAPWWASRGPRPVTASVDTNRCTACNKCFVDCPYDAITMVPRTDGRAFAVQAEVDPAKCVGCGICAGACDTGGVGLPWLTVRDERRRLEQWLEEEPGAHVAVLCAESAAASLDVDPATGRCDALPGYRSLSVPCLGWLHPVVIERALKRGAGGVLLAGCPDGSCQYREGMRWARERVAGDRAPSLNAEGLDRERIRLVAFDATQRDALVQAAAEARGGAAAAGGAAGRAGRAAFGVAISAAITAAMVLGSRVPYAPPVPVHPGLVVSFKHPGQFMDAGAEQETREDLLPHMRPPPGVHTGRRKRCPVRLEVAIDGQGVHRSSHAPTGLWGDGNSIGLVRLDVPAGVHAVEVRLADTPDGPFTMRDRETLKFDPGTRHVVLFDRIAGFSWHAPPDPDAAPAGEESP